MTSPTAPILIMSSERSGSNLLRTLLSNHDGLAGPMAAQFLSLFEQHVASFEPLDDPANGRALIEVMLAVANHEQFKWGLDVDPAELVTAAQPADLDGAFDALYRARAAQEGARRYVCKENRLFDHAERLVERFPGTAVVYLVRDPRDYVLSWQRAPILNNTPHEASAAWRDEQRACMEVERRLGDRVLRVTYEELVQDTPAVMTRVLAFAGEEPDPACFEVETRKNQGERWSSFWTNLTKPVQSGNFNKYRDAFDRRTLELIETVCAAEMDALGYAAETPRRWRPAPFFRARERRLARQNDDRLRQEHASTVAVIADRDAMLRRMLAERS